MMFTVFGSCPIRVSTGAVRTKKNHEPQVKAMATMTYRHFCNTLICCSLNHCLGMLVDATVHHREMIHVQLFMSRICNTGHLGILYTPDTECANLSPAQQGACANSETQAIF